MTVNNACPYCERSFICSHLYELDEGCRHCGGHVFTIMGEQVRSVTIAWSPEHFRVAFLRCFKCKIELGRPMQYGRPYQNFHCPCGEEFRLYLGDKTPLF